MYANRRNLRVLREIGVELTMVTSDFRPEVEIRPFRACPMTKIRNITLIYGQFAEISASYGKSGSKNTMVTSDFRPEVEI